MQVLSFGIFSSGNIRPYLKVANIYDVHNVRITKYLRLNYFHSKEKFQSVISVKDVTVSI